MQYVSLRDFQLNANNYLEALPIILTRYNIPVAEVYPIGKGPESTNTSVNTSVDTSVVKESLAEQGIRCLAPNANCKLPAEFLVTYENPETFETETNPYCETHLNWLKKTYEVESVEEI